MTYRSTSRTGLTVLELVAALALFVIILGTLLIALNSATDTWKRSADKSRDQQKVRQALDMMATDLACAVTENMTNQPLFVASYPVDDRYALYFVKVLSPGEVTSNSQLALELISYALTTNGLSRYTQPVLANTSRGTPPDIVTQLNRFRNAVDSITIPSNILSSSIVFFLPHLYRMQDAINNTAYGKQPPDPPQPTLNNIGTDIELNDLPDFVDIRIEYVYPDDWANGYCITNYMTRRITLPAAQASRLP